MDPDALAGSFGYTTGGALVDRMIEFERAKGRSLVLRNSSMRWLSKKPIEGWNLKYGELNENILKEAYNHVVSLTQMGLA